YPFMRTLIERVFQAPVFETYGSREFMLIGAECDKHTGLHLVPENHVVEVVDELGQPTPPGEEGNVVITDLTNYGMPFIRYLNRGWSESDRRLLVSELGKVLGPEVDVDLLPVDDIPLTMTGKHRVVVRTIQTSANGRVEST